jgi:hypothetical protein
MEKRTAKEYRETLRAYLSIEPLEGKYYQAILKEMKQINREIKERKE